MDILELAKQGYVDAVAHLLKQSLQSHDITVKVSRKDDCLKVVLESAEVPEQDYLVAFILREMTSLKIKSISKVKVYGRQAKTFDPAWHQEFELENKVESPSSGQSKNSKYQTSSKQEFSRKTVSEVEFRAALAECSKTARQAYQITLEYAKQIEGILQQLNTNLSRTNSQLLSNKDAARFEFACVLKDIVSEVKHLSKESIEDLVSSLDIKRKHLEDFTIALFGRTKAGKSTIREALTSGDGGTIGKGSQRTTRDVREYRWQGLRLLDTPGIEAYQGEEDTAKANEVIDQSDMLIFLTSDDSVQPGEFKAMAQLQRINKYFAVILNIKHDISKQPEDLLMFIDIPEMVFDEQRLAEHQNHIQTYIKEHLEIDNVDLVCIHAQAAFLSTKPKYQEYSQRLWNLSKIEELYYLIASDIHNNGQERRNATFFDSSISFISEIEYKLEKSQYQLHQQVKFMLEQRGKLKNIFEDSIQQGKSKIKNKCEALYNAIENQIGNFVDEYAENSIDIKNKQWQTIVNKKYIESTMKDVIDEIVLELQEEMKEFSQQYQYDFKTIKIDVDNVKNNEIRKRKSGRDLNWAGVAAGAAAAVFVAVNWWNPAGWVVAAGWIATGVGVATKLAADWKNKEEDQDFKRDIEQEKKSLRKQVEEKNQETLKSCQDWLDENIGLKFKKEKMAQVDLYIKGLSGIASALATSISEIQKLKKQIETDLYNCN